ncbi:unnamed protein product [marine sediment metagenome]|uniref:Uncharacterized protein n=1 Tax=marine sediment metagenome TaxID=412755 RepID=X1HRS1_9ZZZZ
MWYGILADIPADYLLCDGSNGTLDMRDKFAYGAIRRVGVPPRANGEAGLADSGGSISHNHDAWQDYHEHVFLLGPDLEYGDGYEHTLLAETPAITVQSETELPPWRALYYLMKK